MMIDIYVAESMSEYAQLEYRDSLKALYLTQVAEMHGMKLREMEDLLQKLAEMPDSMYTLQGIALDSLKKNRDSLNDKKNSLQ
ncbi:MAG: hypothetical protein WAT79_03395 [Saprospiraceae bacterium]